MPFPYYARLSKRDRAIYRKSDAIDRVELPDPAAVSTVAEAIRTALEADDRAAVARETRRLVRTLTKQLQVPRVDVRVLSVRPRNADSELHGLYVREEDAVPIIHVWMRTAARKRTVAFRTFLRTLLHELCHHLDYTLLGLADSFHTEGFFRRESSLVRQLVATPGRRRPRQLDLPL